MAAGTANARAELTPARFAQAKQQTRHQKTRNKEIGFTAQIVQNILKRQQFDEFHGKGPRENAELIRAILQGEEPKTTSAARDLVMINAAAALHLAGIAPDLRSAANLARESIDTGRAASKLDALVLETNRNP